MKLNRSSYQAVDQYARARMARGEVLGWAEGREPRSAILLVRHGVNPSSFPDAIHGVTIRLREIVEPRPLG